MLVVMGTIALLQAPPWDDVALPKSTLGLGLCSLG